MPSFPTQPTVGEIFTFGQYSWQWTGTYWQPYVSSSTSFTAITSVGNGYSIINNTTGTTLELRSFSGINITIITGTSGTLTFSASTGGGGGGTGSSGTSGLSFGSSGTSGASGSSGTSGASGSSGTSGASGSSGTSGASGSSGTSGNSGSSGTSGENGSSGTSGNSGSSGTSGTSPDISGTINYIPKFTGATSLGNSLIYDDGTNLGIGTASPSAKLDIITPSSSSIGLRVSGDSTTDLVRITQTGSGNAIVVEDETNPDATPFVVAADGRVGIGLTAPLSSYKLHVRNGTATSSAAAAGTVATFEGSGATYVTVLSPDASNAGITFGSGSDRLGAFVAWNHNSNQFSFNTDKTGGFITFSTDDQFERMRITSAGDVGIGTTSPSAKLDINASTGGTIGVRISGDSSSDMLRITQTGSGNAILVEDSSNPDSTPFVVTSGGTVGIGITSPSYFLEAISTGGVDAVMMFDGGTAANANLIARADTTIKLPVVVMSDRNSAYGVTTSFYIGLDRSPSSLFAGRNDSIYVNNYTDKGHYFVTANSGGTKAVRMSILGSGNVGIGTSSPENLFHVFAGSAGTVTSVAGTVATIENSTTNYLSMIAPDNQYSGIVFGSPSDSFGAYIRWRQSDTFLDISTADFGDYIRLGAGNSDFKAYVTSTGFGVNTLPSQALHVSGNTLISGGLTATTISATTYNNLPGSSSSNCFGTFYTSAISGCSPVTILTPLNATEGLNVTGTTIIQSLSATSFSASTYQGNVVTQITAGSGISIDQSTGNVTITATGGGGGLTFQQVQMVAFLSS